MIAGRDTKKRAFQPLERCRNARLFGVSKLASLDAKAEARMVERALQCDDPQDATFWNALTYFVRARQKERRLLERYLSLPRAAQKRNVYALEANYDLLIARDRLLSLASDTHGEAFWKFAIAFTRIGGNGVRPLLRRRLAEMADAVQKQSIPRIHVDLAQAYTTTAAALLFHDPHSARAANVLVAVYRDRARYGNDSNAVEWMRESAMRNPHLQTRPIEKIRAVLRELLEPGANLDDFASALPGLTQLDRARAGARAATELTNKSWLVRTMSAQALRAARDCVPGANRLLAEYVSRFPDDMSVLECCDALGTAQRLDLIRRTLTARDARSRLSAATRLNLEPGTGALRVANEAVRDEPEPLIQHFLRERIAQVS